MITKHFKEILEEEIVFDTPKGIEVVHSSCISYITSESSTWTHEN